MCNVEHGGLKNEGYRPSRLVIGVPLKGSVVILHISHRSPA